MAKKVKEKKAKKEEKDIRIPTWRDQILPSQLEFKEKNIAVGDSYGVMYTIFNYPQSAGVGWLRPIMLMENTIVSIYAEEGDKRQILDAINFNVQRELAKRNEIEGKRIEVDKIQDSENKIEKAMALSERIVADNAKVVNCTIYIQVYAASREELSKRCTEVEGKLSGRYFVPRVIKWKQEEGFESLIPIAKNSYSEYTANPMTSDVFYGGLPMFPTNGINDPSGNYMGYDSSNNPIFLDIWSKAYNKSNANVAILGKSGSGKSATTKQMLIGELSRQDKKTKLIILDAEKEYLSIADEYGGNVIDAAGESGSMINPLQLRDFPEILDDATPEEIEKIKKKPNFKGSLSTHVSFLKSWFQIYQPELTMAHLALIEDSLYEMYGKFGITEFTDPNKMSNTDYPTLNDLGLVILQRIDNEEDDNRIFLYNEILLHLNSVLNGADRFLFNGHTNVDLSNAINIFNVSKLLDVADNIRSAAFNNITSFVWLAMTKDRDERVILVVDEAHLFISQDNPQTFTFLGQLCKRARKYAASLWVATQNLSDFLHESISKTGEGIMNNCSTRVLMHTDGTDLEKATKLFILNEGEHDLLLNAQIGQGLLIAGDMKVFANIEIEPSVLNLAQRGGGK